MLAYALPIGNNQKVLWVPGPQRFAWGELHGLDDELTVLSSDLDLDTAKISLQMHDNVFRPTVRKKLTPPLQFGRVGWRQLWGLIWLLGMTQAQMLEDLVGGFYLLLGLPLFMGLRATVRHMHDTEVLERFKTLFYAPTKINVVYSKRLEQLESIIKLYGIVKTLEFLDKLGFQHLREFYKRCAWQPRWETPPPTGQGMLK